MVPEQTNNESKSSSAIHLRILQLNDVYQLANFPRLKTLFDHYSSSPSPYLDGDGTQPPTKTIICCAGDFVAPSLLSSLDRGRGMVALLSATGVTHVCIGNHEADIPPEALADHIHNTKGTMDWINSNMRLLDKALHVTTPEYSQIDMTSGDDTNHRSVALLGLLTDDPYIYREGAFGGAATDIESPIECTERFFKDEFPKKNIDIVVPMTHQDMEDDVKYAQHFVDAGHGDKIPIVVGGHDHSTFDESVGQNTTSTRIFKTGMDAYYVGVLDFVWTDKDQTKPTTHAELVETSTFEPNPEITNLVKMHEQVLAELEKTKLFRIDQYTANDRFTTRNNRYEETQACTVMATILKRGLHADCCIVNAGGIRGNKDYTGNEWFTFSDLKSEFPFADPCCTVKMPGSVLEDAICYSRQNSLKNEEDSGFLHLDSSIAYDDNEGQIMLMNGNVFDPDQTYAVALPVALLNGLDKNVPLVKWREESTVRIDEDAGMPIKVVFVEFFAITFWLGLGSFIEMDVDGDGIISRDDIQKVFEAKYGVGHFSDMLVDDMMAVANVGSGGEIGLHEMLAVQLKAEMMVNCRSSFRVQQDSMISTDSISSMRSKPRPTTILHGLASKNLGKGARPSAVNRAVQGVKDLSGHGDDSDWYKKFRSAPLASKNILE